MSNVADMLDRKDRPAYVRFERRPEEDTAATKLAGKYVAKDVDYALITPPYSKDIFIHKVAKWFEAMKGDVLNGRLPQQWADQYHDQYDRWKTGQEMPLKGTAIRGWGVISPAMQETLIRMNIMTVEDLAGANDEGMTRIGMGGVDLKNKANAWLAQLKSKGPLTIEMAAVKQENAVLSGQVETLTKQVAELTRLVRAQVNVTEGRSVMDAPTRTTGISAADVLEHASL